MEILTFHSLHESWQFSMYGRHLTAVSKCNQMVCSGTPEHKKVLLMRVLSPVSYKWRQVYGWYKMAYSHQVKLHQERQNGNLFSWPLLLKKMLETASVVVFVCVFLLFSYTVSVAKGVLQPFFFFFQVTKHFPAGLTLFPFSKCFLFPFFPFSNFDYKYYFSLPCISSYSSGIGCLYSSPFLPFTPRDSHVLRNCLNSRSNYIFIHMMQKAQQNRMAPWEC